MQKAYGVYRPGRVLFLGLFGGLVASFVAYFLGGGG